MLAWPTSVLPNPTTDFSQDNQASVTRTTMQSGRVRQRRWSTSDRREMPVNWQLNDDDFELFQSFVARFFDLEIGHYMTEIYTAITITILGVILIFITSKILKE